MNTLKEEPKVSSIKKNVPEESVEPSLPADRKILDTLYAHYGKPENIIQEKVSLYRKYTTPAGHSSPDWIVDGYQQGRVTVFTSYEEQDDGSMISKTHVGSEGKGSWFIGVNESQIKVYIGGKLDEVLEIGV
jgi:hypothetical protein